MKSKTNISVVSNTGVRRKSEVIIGDSGPYTSGDILDANATQELIGSGGGAGGDYPSDEQIIHVVADATYHAGKTYLEPLVNESLSSDIPTYDELKTLINKYKGQVFIDYTVRVTMDQTENVRELKYFLSYAAIDENAFMPYIKFIGLEGVSVIVDTHCASCGVISYYDGYFECTVFELDGALDGAYEVDFPSPIDLHSMELAMEHQDVVRCVITDETNKSVLYTTLTNKRNITIASTTEYVFSNNYAELKVAYLSGQDEPVSTSFKYFEEQTP